MTALRIFMVAWGIILVFDYLFNRKRKQIEMTLWAYETIFFVIPFVFAFNFGNSPTFKAIALVIMMGIVYFAKTMVLGTKLMFGNMDEKTVFNEVKRSLKTETAKVSKDVVTQFSLRDGTLVFMNNGALTIKNNLNLIRLYQVRRQLASALRDHDQRINNAFVYLILGLLCIGLGIYRMLI